MDIVSRNLDAIIASARAACRDRLGYIDDSVEVEVPTPIEQEPIEEPVASPSTTVPENSGSELISSRTSRFSGAIWYDAIQRERVTLAGVGGIGSYVCFLLSRLNVASVRIYDDDIVDESNISGQLFRVNHIGQSKVYCAANIAGEFSNYYCVNTYANRFSEGSPSDKVMICGFDNMDARRMYFNTWRSMVHSADESDKANYLFIDGRLAAEELQVFCIRGDDTRAIQKYETEFLFADSEADATVCSYKQTTFMANMIGSIMVNLFVNFVANKCEPLIDRDLPFFTSYDASTMYFNVIS